MLSNPDRVRLQEMLDKARSAVHAATDRKRKTSMRTTCSAMP